MFIKKLCKYLIIVAFILLLVVINILVIMKFIETVKPYNDAANNSIQSNKLDLVNLAHCRLFYINDSGSLNKSDDVTGFPDNIAVYSECISDDCDLYCFSVENNGAGSIDVCIDTVIINNGLEEKLNHDIINVKEYTKKFILIEFHDKVSKDTEAIKVNLSIDGTDNTAVIDIIHSLLIKDFIGGYGDKYGDIFVALEDEDNIGIEMTTDPTEPPCTTNR